MRFVSMYPKLNLGTVIKEKFDVVNGDELFQTRESVSVQFTQEYMMQDDIDFALSRFPASEFRGRMLEADGITPEPLTLRIGVFDTEVEQERQGWDDETREKVEHYCLNHKAIGISFVKAEPVVREIAKPWPSYNSTHHFKVAGLAEELGLLEEALAYERANKARDGVIEALEEKIENRGPRPSEEAGEVVAA